MSTTFPEASKLVLIEKAPKAIPIGFGFAKPTWFSETKRYWISCNEYGYATHLQSFVPKPNRMDWCYIDTQQSGQSLYTKTLSGSVKRIEELVEQDRKFQQKEKQKRQEQEQYKYDLDPLEESEEEAYQLTDYAKSVMATDPNWQKTLLG
jgi:hypothetical protein